MARKNDPASLRSFGAYLSDLVGEAGLNAKSAAARIGVYPSTFRDWMSGGRMPFGASFRKLQFLFPKADFSEWASLQKREPADLPCARPGLALREARLRHGMDLPYAAARLRVSARALDACEHGISRPDDDVLLRAASVYGLDYGSLYAAWDVRKPGGPKPPDHPPKPRRSRVDSIQKSLDGAGVPPIAFPCFLFRPTTARMLESLCFRAEEILYLIDWAYVLAPRWREDPSASTWSALAALCLPEPDGALSATGRSVRAKLVPFASACGAVLRCVASVKRPLAILGDRDGCAFPELFRAACAVNREADWYADRIASMAAAFRIDPQEQYGGFARNEALGILGAIRDMGDEPIARLARTPLGRPAVAISPSFRRMWERICESLSASEGVQLTCDLTITPENGGEAIRVPLSKLSSDRERIQASIQALPAMSRRIGLWPCIERAMPAKLSLKLNAHGEALLRWTMITNGTMPSKNSENA